ncbi:MAG TPA: hypothetical protein PKL98_03000, partial [Candidatus Pacearchaeota archaeon]|nr:hypothetical protein [Candidatus Pacearchaeota archaeon]
HNPIGSERIFFQRNANLDDKPVDEIIKTELRAASTGNIYFSIISGRDCEWYKMNYCEPAKRIAESMNLKDWEKRNIEKGIILLPEMGAFRIDVFSDNINQNIPSNHISLKKEIRGIFQNIFLDINDLPIEKIGKTWFEIMDANNNQRFFTKDKDELYSFFRKNGKSIPPITCATFSTKKRCLMNGELHRKFNVETQKWEVPYSLNDQEIIEACEIIKNKIKEFQLQNYFFLNPVATSLNIEVIVENEPLGKESAAEYAFKEVLSMNKSMSEKDLSKFTLAIESSPAGSELAKKHGAFCYVGKNPLSDEQKKNLIAIAKQGVYGSLPALEAMKVSIKGINFDQY